MIIIYVGTLIAYRHVVFKLKKVYVKNCVHKQSNMCILPPPTHPGGGWVGMKQNFRLIGIIHKQHVLYPPPTHPWGGWGVSKMDNWNCAYLQQSNMF